MSAPRFPVSVKGVVVIDGRVVLLENERRTWELPGGRLELGEQPTETLKREIDEELNVTAEIGPLIDAHVFEPLPGQPVLILVYRTLVKDAQTLAMSEEHRALGLFAPAELAGLALPEGYRRAIFKALGAP